MKETLIISFKKLINLSKSTAEKSEFYRNDTISALTHNQYHQFPPELIYKLIIRIYYYSFSSEKSLQKVKSKTINTHRIFSIESSIQ